MPIVQAGSKRTYYKEWQPPEGTPTKATLILAHGLGASNNYYTAVATQLARAGYRSFAYDLPGCGQTSYDYVETSLTGLASHALALMDVLGIRSATFVGHSMSGMMAPTLAASHPQRVDALVLVNPVLPSEQAGAVFAERIATVQRAGMEPLADALPWKALGSAATDLHRALVRQLLGSVDPAAYVSLCRVIIGAVNEVPPYERVRCPTLVLAGAEDQNPSVRMCETILERLGATSKQLKVFDRVGHWSCIEAPDHAAQAIIAFMDELQRSLPKI